jgi:DNA-directed RNA polymerase subunit RPC12/RpoP
MVEHRFECVHCGFRVHAAGEDSETARQAAREEGAAHANDAHTDRLEQSARWPDRLAPEDLLTDETAYRALTGWLVPVDDLLVCADCGYYFGHEADRDPVGDAGLVCSTCYDRRTEARDDAVAEAIEEFFR